MKKKKQKGFFDIPEPWEEHWQGMPEFIQEDRMPYRQLIVNFKNEKDLQDFLKLVGQKITHRTDSIWYPRVKYKKNPTKIITLCISCNSKANGKRNSWRKFYSKIIENTYE